MNAAPHGDIELLRERFRESLPPKASDCPTPDTLLRCVLGEAPPGERRTVAEHAGRCGHCAAAWSVAREFAREAGLAAPGAAVRRGFLRPALAAAAALVVVASGVWVLWPGPATEPVTRAAATRAIRPVGGPVETLPADDFLLRWSAVENANRYEVRVFDDNLGLLHQAADLREPQYRVPRDALLPLSPGATVLWQVDAWLPDGRRVTSPTYSVRLR